MNARLYDPMLGRFLSPDPYVQDMELMQNYNRYSYALNNPFKYKDPNGELFLFTPITALTDFLMNVCNKGLNFGDYNWSRTRNAWKIDTSMFQGNFGQIINKNTWGGLNSFIGNLVANVLNFIAKVDNVTEMDGAVAVGGVTDGGKAFTIGHYSMGPSNYTATWKDHLFVHEYGHYMQSQIMGPFYIGTVGIPSLISAAKSKTIKGKDGNNYWSHDLHWYEIDASRKGARHFNRKYGKGEGDNYFDYNSFVLGSESQYYNPRTKQVNSGTNPVSNSLIIGRKPWWF